VKIIAPCASDHQLREDAIAYAKAHNIPIEQTKANIYSPTATSAPEPRGRRARNPANEPEEAMWQWIVSPEKAQITC